MAIVSSSQLKNGRISNKKSNENEFLLKSSDYENNFLSKAEDYTPEFVQDLKKLSLEDLANQYVEIDRQSHILKGKILLEARSRFSSDKEFGKWISTHSLCVGSQQSRNRLMHLAEFFGDDRDMNGIAITVAYEISAPVNREKALAVYDEIRGKNVSVKEVKALLSDSEAKNNVTDIISSNNTLDFSEQDVENMAIDLIDNYLSDKSYELRIAILQKAIIYLKNKT